MITFDHRIDHCKLSFLYTYTNGHATNLLQYKNKKGGVLFLQPLPSK